MNITSKSRHEIIHTIKGDCFTVKNTKQMHLFQVIAGVFCAKESAEINEVRLQDGEDGKECMYSGRPLFQKLVLSWRLWQLVATSRRWIHIFCFISLKSKANENLEC
ncbi:hypothetical protein Droror1_Dr00008738 [Drosera rotundifolia]